MVYMICTMTTQYNNAIKINVEKKKEKHEYQTSTRYHNKNTILMYNYTCTFICNPPLI